MKKKKLYVFAILFAIVSAFTFAFGCQLINKSNVVYAADDDEETIVITKEDNSLDEVLFDKLLAFYNLHCDNFDDPMPEATELTSDMYVNDYFDGMILDLSSLESDSQDKKITILTNLDMIDLSKFSGVNLAHNVIMSFPDVFKSYNYSSINLEDNMISTFDCLNLNYQKLTNLNLNYNCLEECNLQKIKTVVTENPDDQVQTVVNIQNNLITTDKITLPTDENVLVKLSHNMINKEKLLELMEKDSFSDNIEFGFQGVKTDYQGRAIYNIKDGIKIEFYDNKFDSSVVQVKIEKAVVNGLNTQQIWEKSSKSKDDEQYLSEEYKNYQLFETLELGQTYDFGENDFGYYKVVFTDDDAQKNGLKKDITFYIRPSAPQVEMYKDGQKIDFVNRVNSVVELKIKDIGENITYVFKNQATGELTFGDSVQVSQAGYNYYWIYKIVDGCLSEGRYISVSYQKSVTFGWIYILLGVLLFGVVGYIIYKFIPKIAAIGLHRKGKNKKNLD